MRVESESSRSSSLDSVPASPRTPLVTVVVPVYNGGDEIVDNVEIIRRAVQEGLPDGDVEVVVVSDGSIDGTGERLLAARADAGIRVIHYDRNLGKGYAVKLGSLAAHGDWVAIVDADLDLDPSVIPSYLECATRQGLDFAIGSKRHPDSIVHYPRSRRVASWLYQQLNRLLFRLDVRDTQVGLKVFRREIAEQVVPLLLVKQFAFDLELLAVARALGFGRVQELPVRLEYRFSGSGVRSRAVARALWDTAAIFYRLRILRTYQRKRRLVTPRPKLEQDLPIVTLIGEQDVASLLDYPRVEVLPPGDRGLVASDARGELIAIVGDDARPAGNWLSAAVPYFATAEVAVVVVPEVTPMDASVLERGAAAVLESRTGGGSRRSRYFPGNVRVVDDHPTESFVVRRADYLEAAAHDVGDAELVAWLAERRRVTIHTPDTMVATSPAPLFGPHLHETFHHARLRGAAARRTRGGSSSRATAFALAPVMGAAFGLALVALGQWGAGAVLVSAYVVVVLGSAALAAFRFRSAPVGLLCAPALVFSQVAYIGGFVRGLVAAR